jgi:hypothetical protein
MGPKRGPIFSISTAAGLVLLFVAIPAARLDLSGKASAARPGPGPSGWQIRAPITYQNLTIFPVISAASADTSGFATLDESLASGDVRVSEQGNFLGRTRDGRAGFSTAPQVNQLVLVNRGTRPVLLLAGEVVSGGKQDRIIGRDRIVPVGRAPLPLDVFCVEHGRWTGASDQFSGANLMVHPSVREEAAIEQDQKQVWAAVRGEAKSLGSPAGVSAPAAAPRISNEALLDAMAAAGTQSYQKIYRSSPIGTSVESVADEVRRRFERATSDLKGEHLVGVVVAFGDEVVWSDIFASSELFNAYWPKLLSSYVVEAMTRPGVRPTASLEDARDFLRPITGHIEEESEPGVYLWRKQSVGRLWETELAAPAPKPLTLHDLRVLRGDERGFVVR